MDIHKRSFSSITFILIISGCVVSTFAACPPGFTGFGCNKHNLAYQKHNTGQNEIWPSHSSHFAVDNNATGTCTVFSQPVQNPNWWVDLGRDMHIVGYRMELTAHTLAYLTSYIVEIQKSGESEWTTCYSRNSTSLVGSNPVVHNCGQVLLGYKIRVTANHNQTMLEICDFGAFGSCAAGSYGDYCEHECGECRYSTDVCDKETGHCSNGCDEGYYGSTCKDKCTWGHYGRNCAQTCGKCQHNVTCFIYQGECPDNGLCQAGFQPPMCQQPCADYTYGDGCLPCGHCLNNVKCDKGNGTCYDGCEPGYQFSFEDQLCQTECDDGLWGDTCISSCPMCYKPGQIDPGPCNKTNGICEYGCAPGYKQDVNCSNLCDEDTWGLSCANTCGHCASLLNETIGWENTSCVPKDGSCPTGCWIGFEGLLCDRECRAGWYGQNCQTPCGKCQGGEACQIITGECPGECDAGYMGTHCTDECPVGSYGFQCANTCPENCETNCSHVDGSCVCNPGWMGTLCRDVCPANHYGKDCAFPCGNCADGTTCRQTDGYCTQGCIPEWTGLKCIDKEIIEVYKRSYADVIGGTIGGVLAGGLIIAFAVWVVWRYRKDKSIALRALASSIRNSVRRLSIRGRNSLRRSIQRLSMRGRRGQDQKGLGKHAEGPAKANGHKGHRQPRMYECVNIQSNTIHEDDFPRLYLQLQEATPDGRTLLHDAFQSFLAQRPKSSESKENGSVSKSQASYNAGFDDVQLHVDTEGTKAPAFLPLGSNLSGFLLVNEAANSPQLWNHLQQRQIETIISIGKEASCSWRPGERRTIGHDVVECIDVQLHGSHRETKLTVQRQGSTRRAVRHMELFFWTSEEPYPNVSTLLMFLDTFQRLHQSQRERSIIVNYINMYDQAVVFTLVASGLEIIQESKKADILRTVAVAGKATEKAVRDFEGFRFLHNVIFEYITSKDNKAQRQQQQRQQYGGASRHPAASYPSQTGQPVSNPAYGRHKAAPTRSDSQLPSYDSQYVQQQLGTTPTRPYTGQQTSPGYDTTRHQTDSGGHGSLQFGPGKSVAPPRGEERMQAPTQPRADPRSQPRAPSSSQGVAQAMPHGQRSQPHGYTHAQSPNDAYNRPRTTSNKPESHTSYNAQQDRSFRPIRDDPKYPNTDNTTSYQLNSNSDALYQRNLNRNQQEHPYTHLSPMNQNPRNQYNTSQQTKRSPVSTGQPAPQAQPRGRSKSDYRAPDDDDDDDDGGFAPRPRGASSSTVV